MKRLGIQLLQLIMMSVAVYLRPCYCGHKGMQMVNILVLINYLYRVSDSMIVLDTIVSSETLLTGLVFNLIGIGIGICITFM